MSKKILLSWLFMAILCLPVFAQIQEPVKFKTEWKSVSADEVEIVFTGKMDASQAVKGNLRMGKQNICSINCLHMNTRYDMIKGKAEKRKRRLSA